jgi:predicted transcriptional regulator
MEAMETGAAASSKSGSLGSTSLEKALDLCEALSGKKRCASVTDLARSLNLPASTAHRLLAVLKRRGFVRQDEDTARYSLTLKMLDLSFRLLDRSELRLHAYPVLREYVLRTGFRSFVTVPANGEVTYVWSVGPDEVAMHTAYGKEMPGHCSLYYDAAQETRRLSCLRLGGAADPASEVVRFGPPGRVADGQQRLICACAPVHDYSGREVARVGLFGHGSTEGPVLTKQHRGARELARLVSLRLGHLPAAAMGVTA